MTKAILVPWTLAVAAIAVLSAGAPATDPKSTQATSLQSPQATPRNPDRAGSLPLPTTSAGATYVGAETCAQCHYDKFVSYMNQPHSHGGDPRTPGSRFGCESCHGPASNHVAGGGGRNVGGLMNFSKAVPTSERNAVCLQCHTRGSTALWHGSTHDERKLACMDCHAVHGGNQKLLQQPTQQQLCTACHQQVRTALMKTSHHPLREEKMQCTSCHNPHGTQAPRLIAANSINDKCVECHSEKRGPFLFEHPPVRENCLNCHDPHGSSHEPLLVVKKPLLCQRCHASGFHPSVLYAQSAADRSAGRTVYQSYAQLPYRSCTNCHVNIHGSNSPSGKFWHR
jgi:DmsE family decaheme c-type cytochrome